MNEKIKIIGICGKSGSGKDSLIENILRLQQNENHWEPERKKYHKVVLTTTRPMREKEQNDIDYHFVTEQIFSEKLVSGEIITASCFNQWAYGIDVKDLEKDKNNIVVLDPSQLDILYGDKNYNLYIVFLNCEDKIRLVRQLNREQNPNIPEIFRRYKTDEQDFEINAKNSCLNGIPIDLFVNNKTLIDQYNISMEIIKNNLE